MKRGFFMHHKCGSMWSIRILGSLASKVNTPLYMINSMAKWVQSKSEIAKVVHDNPLIFDYNIDVETVGMFDDFRAIHVSREPRDIVVSAYFSHIHTHLTDNWPQLVQHREILKDVDKEQGLIKTIDFLEFLWNSYRSWVPREEILEVSFESLIAQPLETWQKILEWFEWDLDPSSVIEENSFEVLSGRKRGEENLKSHMRKGLSGDWKNHFTDRVSQHFEKVCGNLKKGQVAER